MINKTVENVFLACGNTDMRKSIDTLAAIVQECFRLDPFSTSMFVFCNSTRNKIKILHWEHNGFWLHYRRLEDGKFQWPKENMNDTIKIEYRELKWLLDGLSISQCKGHKKVIVNVVV